MARRIQVLTVLLVSLVALGAGAPGMAAGFDIARLYIEYNSSGPDLGFHVFLDAEDWTELKIVNPKGTTILDLEAEAGGFQEFGLTELFFEGAEPNLNDVPLKDLLAAMPEGRYKFIGVTVDGTRLVSRPVLSHAVPDAPNVSSEVDGDEVTIRWDSVEAPPAGFPQRTINIVGYQIIVGSFQVTMPASSNELTLPVEFVVSLGSGEHLFEVLAIDQSGNQTITEGSFELD